MGLFSRQPSEPARSSRRTIPVLEPRFYDSIHQRLVAAGGTDSSQEIAAGVANAVYNSGLKYLTGVFASRQAKDFEALYGRRSSTDRTAADRMVDFLVDFDANIQSGQGGWLGTLMGRLDDVLSRPA